MKLVRNLENFFEKYIEGFFNKKFSSDLQPVEIAKQLIKEMENERNVGVSHIYVPNSYQVHVNREDFDHLIPYSEAIQEEFSQYLAEEAKRRNYTIIGKPIVELLVEDKIEQVKFFVTSQFTEPIPETKSTSDDTGPQNLSDTRVFTRMSVGAFSQTTELTGLLTIVEGFDTGIRIEIGTNRVNIGRRENNELRLTDMNTSRLHAYILYENGSHVVYDAKSLNGTYLNGHRITRKKLQAGDRIKVGNTIILYEVKKIA